MAAFLGRAVVGNMRGFVFACSRLDAQSAQGLPALDAVLKSLSADYYWPLLEELEPKLGIYRPLVETARDLAGVIFRHAGGQKATPTVIVHRDIVQGLAKTFEILEYAGFLAKREASRAMRSGGRGPRYALNLANLLEIIPKARLTRVMYDGWMMPGRELPIDIQPGGVIRLEQPRPEIDEDLRVLNLPIDNLVRSRTYPYGLTDLKLLQLKEAGFQTIGDLAGATQEDLRKVPSIASAWAERIQNIVGQAVWM